MLTELAVSDHGVIADVTLVLGPGMTALAPTIGMLSASDQPLA